MERPRCLETAKELQVVDKSQHGVNRGEGCTLNKKAAFFKSAALI